MSGCVPQSGQFILSVQMEFAKIDKGAKEVAVGLIPIIMHCIHVGKSHHYKCLIYRKLVG